MPGKLIHRMLVTVLFAYGCADAPESDAQEGARGIEGHAAEDSADDELAPGQSALRWWNPVKIDPPRWVDASVAPGPSVDAGAAAPLSGLFGTRCDANRPCPSDQACVVGSYSYGCSTKAAGYCQPRAKVCPEIAAPVCGCNAKTYANACEAAEAGVQVQYRGACGVGGPACGGFAGTACPGLGECVDDPSDDCDPQAGGADCSGVCICRDPTKLLNNHSSFFDARPKTCAFVESFVP